MIDEYFRRCQGQFGGHRNHSAVHACRMPLKQIAIALAPSLLYGECVGDAIANPARVQRSCEMVGAWGRERRLPFRCGETNYVSKLSCYDRQNSRCCSDTILGGCIRSRCSRLLFEPINAGHTSFGSHVNVTVPVSSGDSCRNSVRPFFPPHSSCSETPGWHYCRERRINCYGPRK